MRSLVQKLAKRRDQVAELEAELAEVQAMISEAAKPQRPAAPAPQPAVKMTLPPALAVPEEEIIEQAAVDLAAEDNLGEGRWL